MYPLLSSILVSTLISGNVLSMYPQTVVLLVTRIIPWIFATHFWSVDPKFLLDRMSCEYRVTCCKFCQPGRIFSCNASKPLSWATTCQNIKLCFSICGSSVPTVATEKNYGWLRSMANDHNSWSKSAMLDPQIRCSIPQAGHIFGWAYAPKIMA